MTDKEPLTLTANGVLQLLPPFPIVLVSTRTNIITINQLAYFSFAPLRIGIAVAHTRHTCELLKKEGEFVVNVPGRELVDAVKMCGAVSGRAGDKFTRASLHPEPSENVKAAAIRECGAHIECRIEREVPFEERTWFVALVVAARKRSGHEGTTGLLCDRTHYLLPGEMVAVR